MPQQTDPEPNDPFGLIKEPKQKISPEPRVVNLFHTRSDADTAQTAKHHSLGIKHDQASAGDHKHDGKNSRHLGKDITISGSTNAQVTRSMLQAMIDILGVKDTSTW